MASAVKKRAEMDKKYQWRLSDIFSSDAEFEKELQAIRDDLPRVAAFRGHVAEDPKAAIRAAFEMNRRLSTLYSYAFMTRDQDSGDSHAQDMAQRAMGLIVEASTQGAFLDPELLEMPDEALEALAKEEGFDAGVDEEKRRNAKGMKQEKISPDIIARVTGLSLAEIAEL